MTGIRRQIKVIGRVLGDQKPRLRLVQLVHMAQGGLLPNDGRRLDQHIRVRIGDRLRPFPVDRQKGDVPYIGRCSRDDLAGPLEENEIGLGSDCHAKAPGERNGDT